jgi:hypothetical protein
MKKTILSGLLCIPISISAYAGLHYHYELPSQIAVPVGIAFQFMNGLSVMIFMKE